MLYSWALGPHFSFFLDRYVLIRSHDLDSHDHLPVQQSHLAGESIVLPLSQSDHCVRSSLGISGFGDLRRDCEVGFWKGVVPKREVGHVRHHVIRRITSEDYTSQM